LWQEPHLRGMTLWLFLEHNWHLEETLEMYEVVGAERQTLGVYDGLKALRILEQSAQEKLMWHDDNAFGRTEWTLIGTR
jgi:hypothetical protein